MHPSPSDGQLPKHLDKIFFGAASVYFLLGLMWIYYSVSNQKHQINEQTAPSPEDSQFIAYLQQSLNVINKASTEKTLVNPETNQPSTVAVMPPPPSAPEKIIERIYIPMYPPNPATSTSPAPNPPSPPKNALPPAPSLPSPSPTNNTFAPPPEIGANYQPPTQTIHQLVGVLESGENSTAIFTFNGLSRRFEIGEVVGSSGGILMGVENQKAIIYYNGRTKYLEVGQGF
ncbi:MAG: hypothetical protein QNJ64_09710 [Crocosphaera sp.]|nr:hypothetical protein [Crocosphaera sp.]